MNLNTSGIARAAGPLLATFIVALSLVAENSAPWDPQRMRVQLSEAASEELRENGRLPASLFSDRTRTGLPVLDSLNQRHGVISVDPLFRARPGFEARHREAGLDRWVEITFSEPREVLAVRSEYEASAEIDHAEPIYRKRVFDSNFPNDTRFDEQWALRNTGQTGGTPGADISIDTAWGLETGDPSVVVLVVDSGIDVDHPDLAPNLWVNPNAGPENGYDGDVHGWNFVDDNANIADASGHGTQVSGIIAAVTHNGEGIAGIAGGSGVGDGVRLMTARTFTSQSSGGFAQALVYGADNGAVIASNSWGYTEPEVFEQAVLDAIDYFIAYAGYDAGGEPIGPIQGGLVIFAAGNSNSSEIFYPGFYAPVIAVAATDHNDRKASFSTYGDWIELSAPGADILTTHRHGSFRTVSGTSFAAPQVSGVAALIASRYPGLPHDTIRTRLTQTADGLDASEPDFVGLLGAGRINASRALNDDAQTPPAEVSDLNVVDVTQTSVRLEWTAPGGSETSGQASSYEIRYADFPIDEDNFADATMVPEPPHPAPAGADEYLEIDQLERDTQYWFALRSSDFLGNTSGLSNVTETTTLAAPEAVLDPLNLEKTLETGTTGAVTLSVSNNGAGPLTIEADLGTFPEWLATEPETLTLDSGGESTLTLTFDTSGLNNGSFTETISFLSNDPESPVLNVAVELHVTGGTPAIVAIPDPLEFGEVFIGHPKTLALTVSNPGTEVLVVDSVSVTDDSFSVGPDSLSVPGGAEGMFEVTFDPATEGSTSGTLILSSNAPDHPSTEIFLSGTGLSPPAAVISPGSLSVTIEHGFTENHNLMIENQGGSPLSFQARLRIAPNAHSPSSELSVLSAATKNTDPPKERVVPVDLIIDDGSAEDSIGLTGGGEFIWLNQFTPDENDYPFVLNQVSVFFPVDSSIAPGDKFDVYIFDSPGESPDEASSMLQRIPDAEVGATGDWTVVDLKQPLYLVEPSDILIGVVNREAGLTGFPAALDESGSPQGRSWIGSYSEGVPAEPTFPSDDLWGRIDDFNLPGNWLVRGLGHRDFARISNAEGTVAPDSQTVLEVTLDSTDLMAGAYAFIIEITTNDPAHPILEIPLDLEVTGDPLMEVEPESVDFEGVMVMDSGQQSVTIRNDGVGDLSIISVEVNGEAFAADLEPLNLSPSEAHAFDVTFTPHEVGTQIGSIVLTTNDPGTPNFTIGLSGEGTPPPEIFINPESFEVSVTPLDTIRRTLTITNNGLGDLHFQIRRDGLEASNPLDVNSTPSSAPAPHPVEFVLDDGTAQNALGLDSGMQFLWANQFTPAPGDSPLFMESIDIFFDSSSNVLPGDPIDFFVYHVPDGEPANGADLIHALPDQMVQDIGEWSSFYFTDPLLIEDPGDVLVAAVFRVSDFSGWPAAIDTSSPSQERSWIGIFNGDPPESPQLPAPDTWERVDELGFAGNWMIRAYGSRAFFSTETAEGTVPPGESLEVAVDFSGNHLQPGSHTFSMTVLSNDPENPEWIIQLTMEVFTPVENAPLVTRLLPEWYAPGRPLQFVTGNPVQLVVEPKVNSGTWTVEETPPQEWVVDSASISHGGSFDPATGKVIFGPFSDDAPRTLTYDLTIPLDATGTVWFEGMVSIDDGIALIGGQDQSTFHPRHPADLSRSGFVLSEEEVQDYAMAWRSATAWDHAPKEIPISYVTRAGALWKLGENYAFDPEADDPPLWWIPTESDPEPIHASFGVNDSTVSATADLPEIYYPGEPFTVSLSVNPDPGVQNYALQEQVPSGWEIDPDSLSQAGTADNETGTLRFGPYFDTTQRTITFDVTPATDAAGEVTFKGVISFDGYSQAIGGTRSINSPPATFNAWTEDAGLSGAADDPMYDPLNEGVPNLLRYALGVPAGTSALNHLPVPTTQDVDGTKRAALNFTIPSTPSDLTYSLEVSNDLIEWRALSSEQVEHIIQPPVDGISETILIDLEYDFSNPENRFYRLSITL